jgi:uncharacterized protein
VRLEWDDAKNRENIRKHDLDFSDAEAIFSGPMLVDVDRRKDYGEERLAGTGFLHNFIVVVAYTETVDVIRVFSLRKALKHERQRFEETLREQLGES